MKELKRTYTRSAVILAAVLLILLIVGSFADLPISRLLYPGKESSLGQFFAAFGELPAFLCLTSAGLLLAENRKRLPGLKPLAWLLGGAALVLLGIVLAVHEATDNVPAMHTSSSAAMSTNCRLNVVFMNATAREWSATIRRLLSVAWFSW